MIKIILLAFLALANCQNQRVVEIGSSSPAKTGFQFQTGGIRSFSGLLGLNGLGSSVGGLRTYSSPSVYSYGIGASRPVGLSYGSYGLSGLGSYGLSGLGSYGLSGLGSYGLGNLGLSSLGNYGVGQLAIQPQTIGLVAAQPAATIAAQPVALVAAAQPSVSFAAQPAAVSIAQPAAVNLGVQHVGLNYNRQVSQQIVPVSAAIQSSRTVEYKSVPFNDEPLQAQVVEVEPSDIPLNIHFKSRSSNIQVSQSHEPGQPGTVEQTQSQDEPSRVIHEVVKPIIQEVREIITPYRQVTQEVQPVVEQVHTVVARGEGVRQQYIAQPVVQQQVQQVRQVQQIAQPVATFQAVQQPVSTLAIQQPAVSTFAIAQPVSSFQAVAQPVSSFQAVAQPAVIGQRALTFGVAAQPVSSLLQSVRSVQQPAAVVSSYSAQPVVSSIAVEAQPAVSFRSGSALLGSRPVVGGSSVVVGSSQPALGTAHFSRTYSENVAGGVDDDESK